MPISDFHDFWVWFAHCVSRPDFAYTDPAFIDSLDRWISQLFPGCSWEMGPERENVNDVFLAISPCRSRERQRYIKNAISLAPFLSGWHFYSSKPAKAWDRRLVLDRGTAAECMVDARDVEIAIDDIDGHTTVHVLWADLNMTNDQRQQGADLLIESEIGEQTMMDLNMTVHSTVDSSIRSDWQAFETLKSVIVGDKYRHS